jgi:hypothetical protein
VKKKGSPIQSDENWLYTEIRTKGERYEMKTQLEENDSVDHGMATGPEFVSITMPYDFGKMDESRRILHISNELKSLESRYPVEKGRFIRHTSLVKIEDRRFLYSIDYVPLQDDEY